MCMEGSTKTVNFKNVNIDGAGTFAIQAQAAFVANFENVVAKNIGYSNPLYSCQGSVNTGINLVGSGNSGFYADPSYCGPWPTPVYTSSPTNPTTPPTTPTPSPTTPTPTA